MRWMLLVTWLGASLVAPALGSYTNFESGHVHPIAKTPAEDRLLVVNTPDGMLEVFSLSSDGVPTYQRSIPVGLEPVSVLAESDLRAFVVNQLSDSVSVVDLAAGVVTATLSTGDEPTDVVVAQGRLFVSVAQLDRLEVFDLADLTAAPTLVPLGGRKPRALAVSGDGTKVYGVVLFSGNKTTVVNAESIFGIGAGFNAGLVAQLGVVAPSCASAPPPYPPLPTGIVRNPALTSPGDGVPRVSLIVSWNETAGEWQDDAGQNWNDCVPYRLTDEDLFVIDASTLGVSTVTGLGTSLFDVSVQPGTEQIWIPHTEARNAVRFEHELGVQGHVVDNRLAVVAANLSTTTLIDLNDHIVRGSDPSTNLAEREASISQPGMMAWRGDGSAAYLTALGSRKLFRVDGSCTAPSCIVGAVRSTPDAVEVGEGPTGVVWFESQTVERAFVVNRFSNSLAVVDTATMTKLDELPLHDPSPAALLEGRRFLYDAVLSSGHGDAACSSCHLFGDRDDLAWDLGDPTGEFVPYSKTMDNVRFVVPVGGQPQPCDEQVCASQDGFDPQKGPMTTQTLRGMLEPLHWRGDRATMNDFNGAFVGLLGKENVGAGDDVRGLSVDDMERFRQFALGIEFPPNPFRLLNDTLPNQNVALRGHPFTGNPAAGEILFDTGSTDAGQPCVSCHTHPFGAGGGTLRGVTPAEPAPMTAAALFNGSADQSFHSDLKIAHLRNMYEKIGPVLGTAAAPTQTQSGFGFVHDGAVPDMGAFFSFNVFTMNAQQIRDIAAFMTHFPTGMRPAVGRQVTLPQGTPPTGTAQQEMLLSDLIGLGDEQDAGRHCELIVTTQAGGVTRSAFLQNGLWTTDTTALVPLTTLELREVVTAPLTFTCMPSGAGARAGIDRDEDGTRNFDDCAAADATTWGNPQEVLSLDWTDPATLAWTDQSGAVGPGVTYDLVTGALSQLSALGLDGAGTCTETGLAGTGIVDPLPDPAPGSGRFYLARATNPCGSGTLGLGRTVTEPFCEVR